MRPSPGALIMHLLRSPFLYQLHVGPQNIHSQSDARYQHNIVQSYPSQPSTQLFYASGILRYM